MRRRRRKRTTTTRRRSMFCDSYINFLADPLIKACVRHLCLTSLAYSTLTSNGTFSLVHRACLVIFSFNREMRTRRRKIERKKEDELTKKRQRRMKEDDMHDEEGSR